MPRLQNEIMRLLLKILDLDYIGFPATLFVLQDHADSVLGRLVCECIAELSEDRSTMWIAEQWATVNQYEAARPVF